MGGQGLHHVHPVLRCGVVEREDHAEEGGPVVEARAEVPLPTCPHAGTNRAGFVHPPGEEHVVQARGREVPDAVHEHAQHRKLQTHAPLAVVQLLLDAHGRVHHQEEARVQGADVVEDVRVAKHQAEEDHEKVEPPHHLHHADRAEVRLHVEEGEVAEPRHPHVARDHDANRVVGVFSVKVVVHQEGELHPTLPLLSLLASQNLRSVLRHTLQRDGGNDEKLRRHSPVQISVIGLGEVRIRRVVLSAPAERKDPTKTSGFTQQGMHRGQ
mmetsp:Transcript_5075/g.9548  ORF Transcript_5075/g.9548 Transcript_5075/m.9548 type:complete len:269 (-) Transcript_5075:306-1112(-)